MKIGVYCRVSSKSQEKDGSSLEVQEEKGIEFCKSKGFEYEIFSEVVSGRKLGGDRDIFSVLERKIFDKEIEGIWLYDWDRMVRDVEVMIYFRKLVEESGIKVFVGFEEKNIFDDSGSLEYNIRNVISDFEVRKIKRRMYEGKLKKWREGKGLSNIGFGWKKNKEKDKWYIDELEGKVIKDIYRIYLRKDVKFYSDVESRVIKKYGNDINGYRIDGGLVGRILGNEKVKGIKVLEDESGNKYEFNIGRIISDDVFDEVVKKVNKSKVIRKGNEIEDYLLRGMVKCGSCGSNMWSRRSGNINKGKGYYYLYCNNDYREKRYERRVSEYLNSKLIKKLSKKEVQEWKVIKRREYEIRYGKFEKCSGKRDNVVSRERLVNVVWDGLFRFLGRSDEIKEMYKIRYNKGKNNKSKYVNKKEYYLREIGKIRDKKVKIVDEWVDGNMSDEVYDDWKIKNKNREEVIREKIRDLDIEIDRFDNVDSIDGWMDLMKDELYKDWSLERFEDKKRLVEKYLDWVSVEYLDGDNIGKRYRVRMRVSVGKKGYGIEFENGKSLENNGNKKRDIGYISRFKCVNDCILIYKDVFDFEYIFDFMIKYNGNKISVDSGNILI